MKGIAFLKGPLLLVPLALFVMGAVVIGPGPGTGGGGGGGGGGMTQSESNFFVKVTSGVATGLLAQGGTFTVITINNGTLNATTVTNSGLQHLFADKAAALTNGQQNVSSLGVTNLAVIRNATVNGTNTAGYYVGNAGGLTNLPASGLLATNVPTAGKLYRALGASTGEWVTVESGPGSGADFGEWLVTTNGTGAITFTRTNAPAVVVSWSTNGFSFGNETTTAASEFSVAFGFGNLAMGGRSVVSGGVGNMATGHSSTVGGGNDNGAAGASSTVGGGVVNTASSDYSTVGGGHQNTASGDSSTVGGGTENTALGNYSTVPGGLYGRAVHNFSFVWNGDPGNEYQSSAEGGFHVNPQGGAAGFYIGQDTLAELIAAGPGSGEANTASNIGGGTNIFAQKAGVDFEFKTLLPGNNVTFTVTPETVTINTMVESGPTNTAPYTIRTTTWPGYNAERTNGNYRLVVEAFVVLDSGDTQSREVYLVVEGSETRSNRVGFARGDPGEEEAHNWNFTIQPNARFKFLSTGGGTAQNPDWYREVIH